MEFYILYEVKSLERTQYYILGIDVGSTTVKTVVADPARPGEFLWSDYRRHYSKVRETLLEQLTQIHGLFPDTPFRLSFTGSAGLGIAEDAKLPFVQEVYAAFTAVKASHPDADVVVELGGEDAKIIFLTGGTEQRMNGSCAGGTGAFIDQMATLLGMTPTELDELSFAHQKLYPIASRCGVFAKSDIQPLLNQGANRADIAASIYQAVVDQTVSGLAQGRKIQGKVLFLGGPLSFLKGLREAFVRTLKLTTEKAVFPENASCFMAYGSALHASGLEEEFLLPDVMARIRTVRPRTNAEGKPLFASREEYEAFTNRHAGASIPSRELFDYEGDAYLGIDAGSTTTKLALITPEGELLYSHYASNRGQPLDGIVAQLKEIYRLALPGLRIISAGVTGYGEDLLRAALRLDVGVVETVAHYTAARFFRPDVDFIIDIGGQDIKCFHIRNGAIDSIMLNEACSSGCGSFIQTFAEALGYGVADFAKLGLFAEHPVDLGSRCTVFMNSSVKQAQKEGASVADISAGLSQSIVKNAVYKVIRANSPEELGESIVVQGGTFLNDAVLRAFEQELNRPVVRPAIAGLMGAFGAALYAMERADEDGESTILSPAELASFSYKSKGARCGLCTANCSLTVNTFSDGRKFISGNRCERPLGIKAHQQTPNAFEEKYQLLLSYRDRQPVHPIATLGIPLSLSFYDLLPFWQELFYRLRIRTVLSEESSRALYYKGQHTIPSDTVCYPAKLVHGAVLDVLEKGVDAVFNPCMTYNLDEGGMDNHYNCPVVAYYPELLKANLEALSEENFLMPYLDLNRPKHTAAVLAKSLARFGVKKRQIAEALPAAFEALAAYHKQVEEISVRAVDWARANSRPVIVLAGRPYHLDPEINHGVHKLIASLGMVVIPEDAVAHLAKPDRVDVLNQWTYHARLYNAAEYVTTQPDMQLVQLVSFGCGIDSITTDEVRRILESRGKLCTQLKIDEISNLGAVKIRLRSLAAAIGGVSKIPERREAHARVHA